MIVLGPQNSPEVTSGNLGFRSRMRCRYASIRSSLVIYFLLTWQTTSAKSQQTLSSVIQRVTAIISATITASYSASLFVTGKTSVNDCSIMEPLGVVRPSLTPVPLTV